MGLLHVFLFRSTQIGDGQVIFNECSGLKLEQSEKTKKGMGADRRCIANSSCDGLPCRDCR